MEAHAMKTECIQTTMDSEKRLQLGQTYMIDAQQCETESDYIAAEGMYQICCDIFSSLMEQNSPYMQEAKGEYMHTLFRCAMLPQVHEQEKMQYLQQARTLAAELEKSIDDLEYSIARDCIEEEIQELNKTLEQQFCGKQQQVLQF